MKVVVRTSETLVGPRGDFHRRESVAELKLQADGRTIVWEASRETFGHLSELPRLMYHPKFALGR